ncbi:unnamed protein product [Clonostachys rhizophaga]|uniref:Uncharacterized protein n=1 Tax=Clonostachys rhizophaga TaxID=160324 RepID=A0A9N9VW74_9HYPO|nr:unnamed protein product [Clonostachys rhizophaga]
MDEDENADPLDALGLNKLFSEFKEKYVQSGFEADGISTEFGKCVRQVLWRLATEGCNTVNKSITVR